jgi:hypothetical protein
MRYVGIKRATEDLANAIILDAVEDYKRALTRLKNHPESKAMKRDVKEIEKFFYSDWFLMLTNLDPSYLTRKVKETIFGQSQGE